MQITSIDLATNYLYALKDKENHILYDIPAGKPDGNEPRSLGPDTRPRVDQPGQKGPNCMFYAMSLIRARIGKNPCIGLEEARKAEAIFSKYRKEHSLNAGYNLITLFEGMKECGMDIPEIDNNSDLQRGEILLMVTPQLMKSKLGPEAEILYGPDEIAMLQKFISQDKYKNIKDYVEMRYLRDKLEILEKFVPSNFMSVIKKKPKISQSCVERVMASQFGLKSSQWSPQEGCASLIKELKKHGPLYIGGDVIGVQSYRDKPFEMKKKISGKTISAWPPGTERVSKNGHVIILIGAKIKNGRGYVYFIDPVDPSPLSEQRKIYLISYEKLSASITNDLYTLTERMDKCYAYYGNFQRC